MAKAVGDAFRYNKLVLATTTYNGDIFPFMREFIDHLTERNLQNKTVAFIENGSWAPLAAKIMKGKLEKSKNITYTNTTVKILSALNAVSEGQIADLANELCEVCTGEACAEEAPAPAKKKYICKVCGYVHEAEELPADFRCPLCGVGAKAFIEK
jgi:rubrerythrin